MKRNKKEIHYLNTYCEGDYSYQDYINWCEEQEKEPAEEGSQQYWNWIGQMVQNDVDDFFDNLKYSDCAKQSCVISGTLGLWHGRPGIEPVMTDNLEKAIRRCWDGCQDITVTLRDGVVHVEAMHHDGTNHFAIRPLTQRGEDRIRNGESISVSNHWHTGKYPEYLF